MVKPVKRADSSCMIIQGIPTQKWWYHVQHESANCYYHSVYSSILQASVHNHMAPCPVTCSHHWPPCSWPIAVIIMCLLESYPSHHYVTFLQNAPGFPQIPQEVVYLDPEAHGETCQMCWLIML